MFISFNPDISHKSSSEQGGTPELLLDEQIAHALAEHRVATLPQGEEVQLFEGASEEEVVETIQNMLQAALQARGSMPVAMATLESITKEPTSILAIAQWFIEVQNQFPEVTNMSEEVSLYSVRMRQQALISKQLRFQLLTRLRNIKDEGTPGFATARALAFPHELILPSALAEEVLLSDGPRELVERMGDARLRVCSAAELSEQEKRAIVELGHQVWDPRGIHEPIDTLEVALGEKQEQNTFAVLDWQPSPEKLALMQAYGSADPIPVDQDGRILLGCIRLEEKPYAAYVGALKLWKPVRGLDLAHVLIEQLVLPVAHEQDRRITLRCELEGAALNVFTEFGAIIADLHVPDELDPGVNVAGLYELHFVPRAEYAQYTSRRRELREKLKVKPTYVDLRKPILVDSAIDAEQATVSVALDEDQLNTPAFIEFVRAMLKDYGYDITGIYEDAVYPNMISNHTVEHHKPQSVFIFERMPLQ